MKILILILALTTSVFGQQTQPTEAPNPQKELAEINASLATVQGQLNDLNQKKAKLESERLALIEILAAGQTTEAFESGVKVVVRVAGERSVVLLINGREREVQLSGVMVKMGYGDQAVALLNRALLVGIAYPRCTEPSCSEVELFASRDQASLNCQLVDSGLAMLLSNASLTCSNNAVVTPASDKTGTATVINRSEDATTNHTPGTDVHVKGYYRKDGTYVKPGSVLFLRC